MYYRDGLKIQKITVQYDTYGCTDLSVADTNAGEKDEGELGDVEIRLRHEGGQLDQHRAEGVHCEGGGVVSGQRVQQLQAGQLEGPLVLTEERRQDREAVRKDASEVDPQGRRGHKDEGLDCSQPGNLVLQPVKKYGETGAELLLEIVAQVGHNLSHTGDGALLHLLINILGLETKRIYVLPPMSDLVATIPSAAGSSTGKCYSYTM